MIELSEESFKNIYKYSHFISSTICVICLKKFNPILLFVLLALQLWYICKYENESIRMPAYLLLICGIVFYFIEEFVVNSNKNIDELKFNFLTIWKIPYYCILLYYVSQQSLLK